MQSHNLSTTDMAYLEIKEKKRKNITKLNHVHLMCRGVEEERKVKDPLHPLPSPPPPPQHTLEFVEVCNK